MEKKEYIINQLRKTTNKIYENYCITRIYHKLDRLDVKIITQQLFKRKNGKIALADLFFPQINTYIEIDESHHLKHIEEDKKRKIEIQKEYELIKKKIQKLEEIILEPLEEIRISANSLNSIESINKQIDNVVEILNRKIERLGVNFMPWINVNYSTQYYINKGIIKCSDNARFRTILDVSNLFNKKYKAMQRCYFNARGNSFVWCPMLKLDVDDCKRIKYDNELSEDGLYIIETAKEDNDKFISKVINSKEKRYVFAKYTDESGNKTYKFIGLYELDREKTLQTKKRSWKKIGDYVDISIYF